MSKDSSHSEPSVLFYEPQPERRRAWPLVVSRVMRITGFIAWSVASVGFYNLNDSMSKTPGPFPLDAAASTIVGGIVASPMFGVAILIRRFGQTWR